jgi:hypothetical protein
LAGGADRLMPSAAANARVPADIFGCGCWQCGAKAAAHARTPADKLACVLAWVLRRPTASSLCTAPHPAGQLACCFQCTHRQSKHTRSGQSSLRSTQQRSNQQVQPPSFIQRAVARQRFQLRHLCAWQCCVQEPTNEEPVIHLPWTYCLPWSC